jgi:hypothetical protein
MNIEGKNSSQNQRPPVTSFGVLAAHVFWFFIGPFVLAIITVHIIQAGTGWATIQDAVFFLFVALMVLARWIDQKSGQGTTIEGAPSSWQEFRRYVFSLVSLSFAVWVAANVLGNYFFKGMVS